MGSQSCITSAHNLTKGFAVQTQQLFINVQRRACYSSAHGIGLAIKMVTKIGPLTVCSLVMPIIIGINYAQAPTYRRNTQNVSSEAYSDEYSGKLVDHKNIEICSDEKGILC